MDKDVSLAVFAAGILLIIFDGDAMNSFGSDLSLLVSGQVASQSPWMLMAGIVVSLVGLLGLVGLSPMSKRHKQDRE